VKSTGPSTSHLRGARLQGVRPGGLRNRISILLLPIALFAGMALTGCIGLMGPQPPSATKTSTRGSGSQPAVTRQPANQAVTTGQSATFAVEVTGTEPVSYQWTQNGSAISGATSASYTTAITSTADSGQAFSVVASDPTGSVTSSTATLTVTPSAVAPVVTTQPVNRVVAVGQTATFTVTATGTDPLVYQWSKNGSAINGAASASYTTGAVTVADSGAVFSVKVSTPAGSATSNDAGLTVNATSLVLAANRRASTLGALMSAGIAAPRLRSPIQEIPTSRFRT